ncbi:MAG: helix-turn-helix domain-containing protein [Oscillospiraceae bacterium]
MTLGQRIKQARLKQGLTQKQLVGDHITRNMLSKIENDSATPSVRTLEYIASRLSLHPGYFLTDSRHSDGTSADGLDDMRAAYKEGRYRDCLKLLEAATTAATTDEGYLLYARSSLAAAHEALASGNVPAAKEFADAADYYNKEGIYYSAGIDAEMSLILAECSLVLDISEFEENAREYERAVKEISFSARYDLARAEYLIKTGENELAMRALEHMGDPPENLRPKRLYLLALCLMNSGDYCRAIQDLLEAESFPDVDKVILLMIYEKLEESYMQLEDYKMAHHYAAKQLR